MTAPDQKKFDIVAAFPEVPPSVAKVLKQHAVVRRGDYDEIAAEGDLRDLDRPWAPATCKDADLRAALWNWCDKVVEWINHEYAWRPAKVIPPCWPQHPHIAHELPALAISRLAADESTGPELLEEWHRHTLPTFFDRMLDRLGESGCRTGKHVDWPAGSRHVAYLGKDAVADRQHCFVRDVHSPEQQNPSGERDE
jgi:hypothetical protein